MKLYVILQSEDLTELENWVNAYLQKGYELVGGIVVYKGLACQSMRLMGDR